ncbi:MAG: biotin--[acetyl-CoA-carboxylase] ligase, partial [Candidatus Eisenbacteria sp.]|nr:biotin--[acetyl-CoA-carboxylase] ligase [Candidatus Eisenbacteria bacterium]
TAPSGEGGEGAPRGGDAAERAGGDPVSLGVEPGTVLDGPRDLGLTTTDVGRVVHYLRTVGSTSTELKALAREGAAPGTVLLADEQTGGRGRSGRTWFSPAGLGVWMSVLLRCELPAEKLAPLSVAAAVSVADALRELTDLDVRVKWPNDLLVGGRKLGGLLVESIQTAGTSVQSAVLGIGLNVNLTENDLPAELAGVATSLRIALVRPVQRLEVLRAVLLALERCFERYEREGIAGFRERWRELSSTLGREVAVIPGLPSSGAAERIPAGIVTGLAGSGALILEDASGGRREVWFGDITLRHTDKRGTDDD